MLQVSERGLFESDLAKRLNIFVGAGFSTLAKNASGQNLPVGDALKTLLVDKFGLHDYARLDLPSLYQVLMSEKREELRTFLIDTYKVHEFSKKYDAIRNLPIEYLYTTNIDDLAYYIFNARQTDDERVLHDVYLYGAPRAPESVVQYIPLHGCIRHDDSSFLFTAGQMAAAFASDRQTWYVFQRELQARPTLFLGYGLRDAGVLQALHDTTSRNVQNRWILLRSADDAAAKLYNSFGFHVIVGETLDFLEYLESRVPPNVTLPKTGSVKYTGQVPSVAQVAQRPIRTFFLGAEPEWSDGYSNQVVRRRINSAIKNSIFQGRHSIVVGLPLSGKSTILKQIAAELSHDRDVLFFDRISDPVAEKIKAEHYGKAHRPLLFVDNLIDSRDAIEKLVRDVNAQIVGAEESLYFDSVSLRALSGALDFHSCSDVSQQDLQGIIDSIPVDIRRWNTDDLDLVESDSGSVGLFESLRRHVFDENLTQRFRKKLAEFEVRDREAFDVYLMACYSAACRTLVSFDMIYMFLDGKHKKYEDVYKITGRIDSFLKEVDLADDKHQDYFSVRSGALARIALREAPNRSFSRVYDRFHAAVPSRVIVDYPTFRRYAYDNNFARRAYPLVKEGLKFYERLVKSSDNAYDFQHGAIYLSRMKSFTEAFSWIELALSKSRGRVYSIRNTHARILFEANIDIVVADPTDQTALDGIRESMSVLKTCIEKDTQRSYHLLPFTDQAIQYANAIQDQDSLRWLTTASERLKDMVTQATVSRSRESYNLRKYRNLLSEVRILLAQRGATSGS